MGGRVPWTDKLEDGQVTDETALFSLRGYLLMHGSRRSTARAGKIFYEKTRVAVKDKYMADLCTGVIGLVSIAYD